MPGEGLGEPARVALGQHKVGGRSIGCLSQICQKVIDSIYRTVGSGQPKVFVSLFSTHYVGRVGLEPTTGGL